MPRVRDVGRSRNSHTADAFLKSGRVRSLQPAELDVRVALAQTPIPLFLEYAGHTRAGYSCGHLSHLQTAVG